MSYQIIIIQGNLTRNVEVRQVGQSSVATFTVATSERIKKADGTVIEESEFHDVELWNPGNVTQYLLKGASVLVEGRIKTDKWQDQNGQQKERKKVRCDTLRLCGSKPQATQPQAAPQPAYPQAPQPYPQQGYPQGGQPYVAQGPAPQVYYPQGQQTPPPGAPQMPQGQPMPQQQGYQPPYGAVATPPQGAPQPTMQQQLDPANYPGDLPFD